MCFAFEGTGYIEEHVQANISQNVFYALQTGRQDLVVTGAEDTLASHLLVFAAEKARKENRVVDIQANCTF